MRGIEKTNTPYDDVFRTLLNDCTRLIIPVINEVFGEHYIGDEEIIRFPNEHFLEQQDGKQEERITDSSFEIIGKETKKYHLECQSTPDSSMLVRFFEYDTQIALDGGGVTGDVLNVTFPHSAVLYLRSNEKTPDSLWIRMCTPGGCVSYEIPVMKIQGYTIGEIFQKDLLFLIPFHIFTYEKKFHEYEKDLAALGQLKKGYAQIRGRLEGLLHKGRIDEYTKCTILDMSKKVLQHIARKYKKVMEGVEDVMGGKILEYEAKTIRNEALRQGREEGIEEGIKGTVSVLKGLDIPASVILEKIQEQYHLSPEDCWEYL